MKQQPTNSQTDNKLIWCFALYCIFVHCFLQAKACTYTWCIPVQVFLKLVKGWALDVQFVVFPHVTQGKLSCQTMNDCGTFSTLNQSLNCIMYDRFVECGKSCWCLQGNKRQRQQQLSNLYRRRHVTVWINVNSQAVNVLQSNQKCTSEHFLKLNLKLKRIICEFSVKSETKVF